MDEIFKFIKTTKKNDAILHNRYIYHWNKHNLESTYYKCRVFECKASITMIQNGQI